MNSHTNKLRKYEKIMPVTEWVYIEAITLFQDRETVPMRGGNRSKSGK